MYWEKDDKEEERGDYTVIQDTSNTQAWIGAQNPVEVER